MAYETLEVRIDLRDVAHVALNRPATRNAMGAEMIAELTDLARTLGAEARIRAIVLSGTGKVFCAGGDLGWMREQFAASREERMAVGLPPIRISPLSAS